MRCLPRCRQGSGSCRSSQVEVALRGTGYRAQIARSWTTQVDPDAVAPPGLFLIEPFPRPQGMIQLWPASGVYIKPTDVCIEPTSPGVHTGMTARSEKTPRRSLKVKRFPFFWSGIENGSGPDDSPGKAANCLLHLACFELFIGLIRR